MEAVLRQQAGVITSAQAAVAGLSEQAVGRRVRSGSWRRLSSGVYLVGGHPYTDEVRVRAAVAGAGEDATLHGLTAAWWHGIIGRAPAVMDVTIPHARRAPRVNKVSVRRRDLHRNDVSWLRHLQVTSVALTVLEAAVAVPDGSMLLDRALQQHVELPMLWRVHKRNLGRRGSAAAAVLLTAAADNAGSHAERLLHRLLRRAGITGWQVGYPCRGYQIDVAFPAQRLALEVDGWAFHSDVVRFGGDRRRQNALVNDGWQVLRFTWHDLAGRPDAVIADIRTALAPTPQRNGVHAIVATSPRRPGRRCSPASAARSAERAPRLHPGRSAPPS